MKRLSMETRIELNDGNSIPALGFGTYKLEGRECEKAVLDAFGAGFRHVDTAHAYGNERSVGNAVRAAGIPRSEIFITTKTVSDHDGDRIREVFQESLEKLQTDYVDLFLIHWPLDDDKIPEAWNTLIQIKEEGLAQSVGVSNFTAGRFENVLFREETIAPAVNQIQLHLFNRQPELVKYCLRKGILPEAYSPLTRAVRLQDPPGVLAETAAVHDKSIPQVMLRFLLQEGYSVVVKSGDPSHIRENADVFDFELTEEEIHALRNLDEGFDVQRWKPPGFY